MWAPPPPSTSSCQAGLTLCALLSAGASASARCSYTPVCVRAAATATTQAPRGIQAAQYLHPLNLPSHRLCFCAQVTQSEPLISGKAVHSLLTSEVALTLRVLGCRSPCMGAQGYQGSHYLGPPGQQHHCPHKARPRRVRPACQELLHLGVAGSCLWPQDSGVRAAQAGARCCAEVSASGVVDTATWH